MGELAWSHADNNHKQSLEISRSLDLDSLVHMMASCLDCQIFRRVFMWVMNALVKITMPMQVACMIEAVHGDRLQLAMQRHGQNLRGVPAYMSDVAVQLSQARPLTGLHCIGHDFDSLGAR